MSERIKQIKWRLEHDDDCYCECNLKCDFHKEANEDIRWLLEQLEAVMPA